MIAWFEYCRKSRSYSYRYSKFKYHLMMYVANWLVWNYYVVKCNFCEQLKHVYVFVNTQLAMLCSKCIFTEINAYCINCDVT